CQTVVPMRMQRVVGGGWRHPDEIRSWRCCPGVANRPCAAGPLRHA
ncbi:MAG: hypothetical protein AVDCRST_MAG19-1384, partial [uncultured Thermomicrobiales bacterium]